MGTPAMVERERDAGGAAPEISVVVPVYRSRETLVALLDRLDRALAAERREYLFVVDGSPDDSLAVLLAEIPRRPWLSVIELSRNFGQHAALCAGFERVRGRVALVLDADLQQSPEDLPRLLERWRAGHDFVSGWRRRRADPLARRLASAGMNALVRRTIGIPLHDWGSPIAAVDRSILERIPGCGEQRRFLKPLVARLSRNWAEVEVESGPGRGASSYSFLTLFSVGMDFAVAFSERPFQRLTGAGFLLGLGGIATGAAYLAARLLGAPASDRLQAVVVLAVLVGFLLLIFGALGEFTHRIWRLVQGLPLYEVQRVHPRPAEREA